MKFPKHILLACLALPVGAAAQTQVNKTIPVGAAQRVSMHFDYPELVKITTWDRNEVSVQGSVSINAGENDDAFRLETSVDGGVVNIDATVLGVKSLPQRITIYDNGTKIVFRDKAEFKKYQQEKGKVFNSMSMGVDMDIVLEIKVPKGMETRVEAVYGMVEVLSFNGPLKVEATYGGVDASLVEKAIGEVVAETNYGEIFTNLDAKFGGPEDRQEDFHTVVSAKPGAGPRYTFESKYGNVYIRKAM